MTQLPARDAVVAGRCDRAKKVVTVARRGSLHRPGLAQRMAWRAMFVVSSGALPMLQARSISAQRPAIPQLLVDRTFHPGDPLPSTIYLAQGLTYRVRLSRPHLGIEMRSADGKPVPFVRDITFWTDASSRTELELTPNSDGEIEFRIAGGTVRSKTRFRLWLLHPPYVPEPEVPTSASPPRPGPPPTPTLPVEFGITERVGVHSAYSGGGLQVAAGGAILEGCVAVRGGHGVLERISGCGLGYSRQGGAAGGHRDLLYFEPHLRIFGPHLQEGREQNWGVLIRMSRNLTTPDTAAAGASIRSSIDVGLGIYASQDTRSLRRGGTQLEAALMLERVEGTGHPDPALPRRITRGTEAVTFRLGGGWFC